MACPRRKMYYLITNELVFFENNISKTKVKLKFKNRVWTGTKTGTRTKKNESKTIPNPKPKDWNYFWDDETDNIHRTK